ncbi:MAG TPA: ComEC/Rec2 family competence protein, partial [Gemmatimonadaceae bacterium]
MPLFAIGVVAYTTGLLLGFAGAVGPPFFAAAGVAMAWGLRSGRQVVAAVALLALGGALVARATSRDDARCLAELARRHAIRVELDNAAEPGALVRAAALDCHADIEIALERGSAPAGSAAIVVGEVVKSARGLLAQHAALRDVHPGSAMARWRDAAGGRVDSLFGADAPLARALLVADRRGIPAEMRDRYAAAGLAHVLSISGLHVGLIAVAVNLVFQLLRLSRRRANVATLVVIAGYVAMLGAPSPALRAAVMLSVLVLSRGWQRPTSLWSILAVGAAIPLVDPRAVSGVGYQLSVAGVAALIAAAALARRWSWLNARGTAVRALIGTALASTTATIVTAPLVAWSFGRLSLIGPVTNLFAGPVIGLAQPMMFLALVFAPVRPVARWLADAAHPLLRAFDFIASTAAAVPGGAISVAPSVCAVAFGALFAVALVVACVSRFPARAATVAVGAMALVAWGPPARGVGSDTELHMIDVGQGDAIAIRTSRGHWVLMDAGRVWRGGDAGRSTVVPYIAHRGGTLVAFILSHPHDDHVGGATSVLHALRPARYYDAAYTRAGEAYHASLFEARRDGIAWYRVHPGDSLAVDEVMLTFLGPDSAWVAGLHDASQSNEANEASAIVLVRVGDIRMLLVG